MAKKLQATLQGFYVKSGRNVYRYVVTGDTASIEAYKEAQGVNLREHQNNDDPNDKLNGMPLFFSTRPEGKNIELDITPNGKVVVAKDVMLVMENDMRFQDKMETELAKIAAQQQAIRMKLIGQTA